MIGYEIQNQQILFSRTMHVAVCHDVFYHENRLYLLKLANYMVRVIRYCSVVWNEGYLCQAQPIPIMMVKNINIRKQCLNSRQSLFCDY